MRWVESFVYVLDEVGNRTAVVSSAGTESYTVNRLDQLTGVTFPDGRQVGYGYDEAGNRIVETVDGTTTGYLYDDARGCCRPARRPSSMMRRAT